MVLDQPTIHHRFTMSQPPPTIFPFFIFRLAVLLVFYRLFQELCWRCDPLSSVCGHRAKGRRGRIDSPSDPSCFDSFHDNQRISATELHRPVIIILSDDALKSLIFCRALRRVLSNTIRQPTCSPFPLITTTPFPHPPTSQCRPPQEQSTFVFGLRPPNPISSLAGR